MTMSNMSINGGLARLEINWKSNDFKNHRESKDQAKISLLDKANINSSI